MTIAWNANIKPKLSESFPFSPWLLHRHAGSRNARMLFLEQSPGNMKSLLTGLGGEQTWLWILEPFIFDIIICAQLTKGFFSPPSAHTAISTQLTYVHFQKRNQFGRLEQLHRYSKLALALRSHAQPNYTAAIPDTIG